ncbi:hypothetical protein ABT364_02535 [Massilia sp. SR12]
MIVLPDDDEPTVGAQVNALIGEALRQSVADAEPSADFTARLAAALDAAGGGPLAGAAGAAAAEAEAEGGMVQAESGAAGHVKVMASTS